MMDAKVYVENVLYNRFSRNLFCQSVTAVGHDQMFHNFIILLYID